MLVYKILARTEWQAAQTTGRYEGSAVDRADGYIHFSTAEQAPETARRYFAGQADLLLLVVESASLGPALRWEPSRGGDLFPHLYGPLPGALVIETRPAPLLDDGTPDLGRLAP